MTAMYGIAEWFGVPFRRMNARQRQEYAQAALQRAPQPPCPFRPNNTCNKKGGVCSIAIEGGEPVIVCPARFLAGDLLPIWLSEIVGFDGTHLAAEVPFMRAPDTGRAAGRIDWIVALDENASRWYGLEVQAVYFSGPGMTTDFEELLHHEGDEPPVPTARRRPDWRSSSAKRLMPQLQVKAPTLRRWGTKLAVAVDWSFYQALGGPSEEPSKDLNDGDIVWLIPRLTPAGELVRQHWEVLSLEESCEKLLAAETVRRGAFEDSLREKLRPLTR